MKLQGVGLGLCLVTTLSCAKSPQWQSGVWQGRGRFAPPAGLVKEVEKVSVKDKQIEFSVQTLAGVPVEGAFAKAVYVGSEGQATYRKVSEDALPSEHKIRELKESKSTVIELARKKRFNIAGCKNADDSLAFVQPTIHWAADEWTFAFKGGCESSTGEFYEYWLSPKGILTDVQSASLGFNKNAETTDVITTLYPLGPKLSELEPTRLTLSATPNYLFNRQLNAVSDSGVAVSDLRQITTATPQDPVFDLLQAYFFTNGAITWMNKKFGFQSAPLKVRTFVGYPESTNATFYYNREVRLGTGDGKVFQKIAWDPSVVVHEFMHSAIETLTRLPYRGEGGSLNEGLADILTAIYLDNPRIGENSYQKGPFQRTLENHLHFSAKTGALYGDSLILSSALWEIKQRMGSAAIQGCLQSLLVGLNPGSTFVEAKEILARWVASLEKLEDQALAEEILQARGWL